MRISHLTRIFLALIISSILSGYGLSQSVFSGQGIGEIHPVPGARLEALGGGGIAIWDSLMLSTANPALPATLKQTRISVSGGYRWINVEDNTTSDPRDYAEIQGIAIAVPIYRGWTASASIDPYSTARSSWFWSREFNGYTYEEQFKISGGFARGLLGIAFPVNDKLLLGGGTRFLFGSVDQELTINFTTSSHRDAQYTNSLHSMSVGVTAGAVWQFYRDWSLAAMYRSAQSGDGKLRLSYVDSDSVRTTEGTIEFPVTVGFGLAGSVYPRVYLLGDVTWTGWENSQISIDGTSPLVDTWRMSAGLEYQPLKKGIESWYNRLYYRLGFYTENHYFKEPSGDNLRTLMGTAGFGFPLIGGQRRLDIAFQFGTRGDIDKFGAKETLFGLSLTLESAEKWFLPSR
jgi:hypothetical protein